MDTYHWYTIADHNAARMHLLCGAPLAGEMVTRNVNGVSCLDCRVMINLDADLSGKKSTSKGRLVS